MDAMEPLLTHASSTTKAARAVQTPYPQSTLQLENHPIDQVRNLRVAVIGAGLAGITAGVLLPAKVPGIKLRIYEKNSDLVSSSFTKENESPNAVVDHFVKGGYMVGKYLSRREMRRTVQCLPEQLCAKNTVDGRICPRRRDPRLLARRGTTL